MRFTLAVLDKKYPISFMNNFTFYKWCVTKVAHCIVKPVLSGHSKIDKTKVLKTNGSLIKVESIAECSPRSILQYFKPALGDTRS